MSPSIPLLLLFGVAGYLLGSVSFARLISKAAAGSMELESFDFTVPNSDAKLTSHGVSATVVREHVGTYAGCLVGLLDMAKAALPTLLLRIWYPEMPYYLVYAATVTAGHIWPLYHGFKGGHGQSPITGGMLAIDWVGVLIMNLAALLLGIAFNSLPLIMAGGMALMIPWLYVTGGGLAEVAYALVVNALYWYAMRAELKQFRELRRSGHMSSRMDLLGFVGFNRLDRLVLAMQRLSSRILRRE